MSEGLRLMGLGRTVLGLAIACALPVTALAQDGVEEVTALHFEGNALFSDRALASAIVTRSTRCRTLLLAPLCWAGNDFSLDRAHLRQRDLARDLARVKLFYYQRGFREAQVDTALTRLDAGRVEVTFTVEEGPPVVVDSIAVVGLERLSPVEQAELLEDLPLEVGQPLNGISLDAVRDTLEMRLKEMGYARADVLRNYFIPAGEHVAEVSFDAFTGPSARFGPVMIVGHDKLSERAVLRMLPFEEGTPYREGLINEGRRNLFGLDLVRHAGVEPLLGLVAPGAPSGVESLGLTLPDSVVPVLVTVNEGDVHRVRAGGGMTTAECFNAEARWESRNFIGAARRLGARLEISNLLAPNLRSALCPQAGMDEFAELNWTASVELTQPWLFSARNSLSARIFFERQSLPDVFVSQAAGIDAVLVRSLGRNTPITLSYRPQISSLEAAEIFFCTSFLVCTPSDIDLLQERNLLAPIAVGFSTDRTNQVFNPSGGYSALLDYEHAASWTGSDFGYDRIIGELSQFNEIAKGTVLSFRLRSGWLGSRPFKGIQSTSADIEVVHPQKRFYAGGANSVRGFSQNQLGPRVLTIPVRGLLAPRGSRPAVCDPGRIMDLSCDAGALDDEGFDSPPRATGGSAVVEGNLELRSPVTASQLQAVAFLDFGQVWEGFGEASFKDLEFTPGIGMRYYTPIGPLRLDVGYRFQGGQRLRVVTSQVRPFDPDRDDPSDRLIVGGETMDHVRTDELAVLTPLVLFGDSGAFAFRRFQIHLSIGQAF